MKKTTTFLSLILALVFLFASCSQSTIIDIPPVTAGETTSVPVVETPQPDTSGVPTESATITAETPTPTQTALKTPVEEKRVSFLAVGDNLIHLAIATVGAADSSEADGYNFYKIYKNYADKIAAADIAYINQETMLDDDKPYGNYPSFNTPEAIADDLKSVGFDIIGIGNNHTLDTGCSGAISTIDKFDSIGLTTIGAYKNAEDEANIRIVEKNGIKIALLSYTYGSNKDFTPDNCGLKLPIIEDAKMISDLEKAKEISDFTVVFLHWGSENSFTPTSEQKRIAKLLADNGAGVLIGTHPHVLQPVEWIEREDGGRMLCAYSLGNFISMMMYDYNMLGGMLNFDIVSDENGVYTDNPILTPTVFYFNKSYGDNKLIALDDFTDEMSKTHGVGLYPKDSTTKNTITYTRLKQYYINTIAEEFRVK